jgi:biotin operon repressor
MHHARLEHSPRLKRVLALLQDGRSLTTLQIAFGAGVLAVNSAIAELRENGYTITCRRTGDIWNYQLQPQE